MKKIITSIIVVVVVIVVIDIVTHQSPADKMTQTCDLAAVDPTYGQQCADAVARTK